MIFYRWVLFGCAPALAWGLASSAAAELLESTDGGFTSEHRLVIKASPEEVYAALVDDVAQWWDAAHSYGGEVSGFSIDARAGGCFCERTDEVSVEHMRVVRAISGRELVMQGGLGPLQGMGVAGSMSFVFSANPEGSELTYRYVVGGYVQGGLKSLAEPVDQVQLGQLQRLRRFVETAAPPN